MINELRLIENANLLFENKVVLYGAGILGVRVSGNLKCAGISVACFCDSNPQKWGKDIDGIRTISPEKLKKLDEQEEIVIIITTDQKLYIMQMFATIEKLQIKTDKILTLLGLEVLFAQNVNNPRISNEYRDFLLQTEKLKKNLAFYKEKSYEINYFLSTRYPVKDILVYSPPKVGSTSVASSLSEKKLTCFQAHSYTNLLGRSPEISKLIIDMLKKKKKTKIITIVREPLSWGGAYFFQRLDTLGAYRVMSSGDSFVGAYTKWMEKLDLESCDENLNYGFEFNWFDRELKAVFGVDVFDHPFDREKGYTIIKQGNVEVLLMKLEKLNTLEAVIGEFVGAVDFKLVNANESGNKPYKYLYKNLKEVIKIPKEVVSLYYDNNPRMDYFYTKAEQAVFLKKWENNIEQ